MRVLHSLAMCLLFLVLPAVAMADHHDALMQEVKAIGDKLAKAMVEDDVDTMMSMYLEDAISLPNNGPRMDGVEAFRKGHDEMASAGMKIKSFESTPTDVWEAGNQVIEIGTYDISLEMGGMPIQDKGKYLTIYERNADGALKVKVETWNTDMNPMEMMGDMGEMGEGEGHDQGNHGGDG